MSLSRNRIPAWLAGLLFLSGSIPPVAAQSGGFLPVDDPGYRAIEVLQQYGYLGDLNPTRLPYTYGALDSAVAHVDTLSLPAFLRPWLDRLTIHHANDAVAPSPGISMRVGTVLANSDRMDLLRPLNTGRSLLQAGSARIFPYGHIEGHVGWRGFVARAGVTHSTYYDSDPDGLDAAHRAYMRSEEMYTGYSSRYLDVHIGRFGRHWARYSMPGLLVSRNPRSYDALALRLGSDRLSLSSSVGELDNMSPDSTFTGTSPVGIHRYLAVHRLDWRPARTLTLTLLEGVLYSGPGANLQLKYLNPAQIFFFTVENTPHDENQNGFIGGQVWLQHRSWTAEAQIVLDDFDLINGIEPASVAGAAALTYADARGWDARIEATLVAARTYRTGMVEGKYVYLERGLAVPFNDYIHFRAEGGFYRMGVNGLRVSPAVDFLLQGEGWKRDSFSQSADFPFILAGNVTRVVRTSLSFEWTPVPNLYLTASPGFNFSRQETGRTQTRFVGDAGIHLNLPL